MTKTTATLLLCWSLFLVSAMSNPKCDIGRKSESLCNVLARPQDYDGELVTVFGDYRSGPEGTLLTESCPGAGSSTNRSRSFVSLRSAAKEETDSRTLGSLRSLIRKKQLPRVRLQGRFYWGRNERWFGSAVAPYEIEVKRILCVEKSSTDL